MLRPYNNSSVGQLMRLHSFFSSPRLGVYQVRRIFFCIVSLIILTACQPPTPKLQPQPAAPISPPANPSIPVYQDQTAGIAFGYPKDWTPHEKGNQIIFSVSSAQNILNLAYPKLPWHIPNLIPIDRVRSGYADDIKSKQISDAVETDLGPVTIPDAAATRVKLAGHINGKSAINEAVLIVHSDHVYILSIHSDDAGYTAARAVLDAAVKSLRWTK